MSLFAVLRALIIIIAFLSLNMSPSAAFDYFPLLFLLVPFMYPISKRMLIFFACFGFAGMLFLIQGPDARSILQFFLFLYFLFGLGVLVREPNVIKKATVSLLGIHLIAWLLILFFPKIGIFESRGGYGTSFFYSEPSYAAITLMSIYVLYVLFSGPRKRSSPCRLVFAFSVCGVLIFTNSLTGVVFAAFVLIHLFFASGVVLRSIVCVLACAPFLFASLELEVLGRLLFLKSLSGWSHFIEYGNVIEPSGMWRINVNIIAFFSAIENPLGSARFYLDKHQVVLPEIFAPVLHNELYDVFSVIRGQSLASSFLIAFGFFGAFFLVTMVCISNLGYFRMKRDGLIGKSEVLVLNLFVSYGLLFQAAITSVPLIIVIAIGLYYAVSAMQPIRWGSDEKLFRRSRVFVC